MASLNTFYPILLGCAALLLIGLIIGAIIIKFTRSFVYNLTHPQRNIAPFTPADVGIEQWQDVDFPSGNLTLSGWFIPPHPDVDGATLLYVHGLSGNRSNLLHQAAHLHEQGYGAFLIDLRHSGQSEGDLSTLSYQEAHDVQAAITYLQNQAQVNSTRLGLIGHSMGGAAIIKAARQMPDIRLIVVQSTFSSIQDSIDDGLRRMKILSILPIAFFIKRFIKQEIGVDSREIAPINDLAHVTCPIMFIHGEKDKAVAFTHCERLYAAAKEPKQMCLIPNGGHIDHLNENLANSWPALTDFVKQHL